MKGSIIFVTIGLCFCAVTLVNLRPVLSAFNIATSISKIDLRVREISSISSVIISISPFQFLPLQEMQT
jgi:hypothetical protein